MEKFDHLFIEPDDFDQSLAFYRDGLCWKEVSSWGGDGSPRGAILVSEGGMSVTIAERHKDESDNAWSFGVNGNRPTVHIEVDNLLEKYASVKGSLEIVVEPESTHWGVTWFVVKDPDQNLLAFFQKAG